MEGTKRRTRRRRQDEEITHKLDLLQEPPNSSQVSGGRWTYHNPVDLNPNATDIRITVPRSDDEFTDLFGAILIVTLSVVNANGNDLDDNIDNVAVNQADHGDMLFQSGQLRINNTATEYIDSYGVLGYIRNLLGMMPDAKTSRLECEGWFEDRARGGNRGAHAADEKLRRKKIAGSRRQVLLLRPKFSLCKQQKMFVPGVEFEFLFRRSPTTMFLVGTDAAVAACKIRIHSAELKVRRCKVDPEVYSALLTAAARSATTEDGDGDGQYKYQHNQLECSEHTLGTGSTSYNITLPSHQKPDKILVVFINQSAHAGSATKQATRFAHLNITHASLKLDGVPTDKEIECDFGDGGDSTIAYNALFDVAFQNTQNASHGVTLEEFRTKSTIFAWNTEDLPGSQGQKNQNVGISLSFKMSTATTEVHTALVIRQTKRQLAVTVAGRVLKER